jgi:hypothetical protein
MPNAIYLPAWNEELLVNNYLVGDSVVKACD